MSLPLFPLNTLLFPGCVLDLQIFEPRYLAMLSACLKQGSGFGVVGILDGQEVGQAARFADLGCEALVRDWQQLPNGLLGVRVEGGRRFRVEQSEVQANQLIQAEVSWLSEEQEQPLLAEQMDLLGLLNILAEHPRMAGLGLGGDLAGQQALSYQLAYLLPLALAEKLELLGLSDPCARLERIETLLRRLQSELLA